MKILEMRPYDKARDEPRTGWDAFSIENAIEDGKQLYVDQYGDIWTAGRREYIGKIRKERDYDNSNNEEHSRRFPADRAFL